jgi:ankyrin repeat protein
MRDSLSAGEWHVSIIKMFLLTRKQLTKSLFRSFLACSLHVKSLRQASTIAEIKTHLSSISGSLDSTYQAIMDSIQHRNPPWALRLVYLLLVTGDLDSVEQLSVRAALQHVGSLPGLDGDIRDHAPSVSVLLSHCRGLVIIVGDRWTKEDLRLSSSEHPEDAHQQFQFCHLSAREYLRKTIDPALILGAKLEVVHTFLRSIPRCLGTLHENVGECSTGQEFLATSPREGSQENWLATAFPLCYYATTWRFLTAGIQDQISFSLLQTFFQHPHMTWLFSIISEEDISPLDIPHYQIILLSKHGLASLLHQHLSCSRTEHLNLNMCSLFGVPALLHAVEKGHYDVCEVLLRHGADANYSDESGLTPIMIAADFGHRKIAILLLRHGADVHLTDEDGWTALSYALNHDRPNKEVISHLLTHGAIIPQANQEGETPLMLTSHRGEVEVVALLLSHGAKIDEMDQDYQTALMLAAAEGHHEVVVLLLRHGASINRTNKDGQNALMLASMENQPPVVSVLLQFAAQTNHIDKDGNTPLILASLHNNSEIVDQLLENGALVDQSNVDGRTALSCASSKGLWNITTQLLRCKAEVDRPDLNGWTPLMHVLYVWGHWHTLLYRPRPINDSEIHEPPPLPRDLERTALLLLQHHANVNRVYSNGKTPLILATLNQHIEMIDLLLKQGADVRQSDGDGCSPLIHGSRHGHLETVSLLLHPPLISQHASLADYPHKSLVLLHYQESMDQRDNKGQTPLIHAVSQGHREVALLLLRKGVDVNLADDTGLSPLMHALHNHDCWPCVSLLIEYGADIARSDMNGQTAIGLAFSLGRPTLSTSMINYLRSLRGIEYFPKARLAM